MNKIIPSIIDNVKLRINITITIIPTNHQTYYWTYHQLIIIIDINNINANKNDKRYQQLYIYIPV